MYRVKIIFAFTFLIYVVKEKGVLIQNESQVHRKNLDISRAENAGRIGHHLESFGTDGKTVTSVYVHNWASRKIAKSDY